MNQLYKNLLIGCAAIGLGASVYAAPTDMPADGVAKTRAQHAHHPDPAKMQQHMAKRQAELHDKLKLTADQEPAWKTFTASMTPPDMQHKPDHAAWQKLSAPERMEKMLEKMKQHEAQLSTHLAAMKTFYAVLTPEQQKVFNDNVGKRHHHMPHHKG